jgi:hypothetical protein
VRILPLNDEKVTLVDDDDFLWVTRWAWYPASARGSTYARNPNNPTKNSRALHRLISNPKDCEVVDHLNCRTLDNRKINLRNCSNSENLIQSRRRASQVKPLLYLACPYSHADLEVEAWRADQVTIAAAELTKAELTVFSPITHSHALKRVGGLRGTWEFWRAVDLQYIDLSNLLVVLTLRGWEKSAGVTAEIEYAKKNGVQIEFLDPVNLRYAQYKH